MRCCRQSRSICLLNFLSLAIPSTEGYQIPFSHSNNKPSPQLQSSSSPFQLQHAVHIGTHRFPGLHLWRNFTQADRQEIDIRASSTNQQDSYLSTHDLKSKAGKIWTHNASIQQWHLARQRQVLIDRTLRNSKNSSYLSSHHLNHILNWFHSETEMPDISDIDTLSGLAKMSNDAYTLPDDDRWFEPGLQWNVSHSFGWQEDGLRGHVFATPDNSSIVISIKGTSAGILGNGGSTGVHDKVNDNLFFSCCCARVSWSWTTVCDCYEAPYRCRQSCLENAVMDKSAYYMAAVDLYNDVVLMYPHSRIWLSGHSLGGAIAGLLGITFGVPTVGFEAPGDLLPAQRLHLPLPPGASFGGGKEMSGVTHVFHTADPIAMGVCNGALSTCSVAGYALETRCHIGQAIVFDTVGKLNWAVDIRTHPIKTVIDKVLIPDWKPDPSSCQSGSTLPPSRIFLRWPWWGDKDKDDDSCPDDQEPIVPPALPQLCEEGDCFKWDFQDSWDDQN